MEPGRISINTGLQTGARHASSKFRKPFKRLFVVTRKITRLKPGVNDNPTLIADLARAVGHVRLAPWPTPTRPLTTPKSKAT